MSSNRRGAYNERYLADKLEGGKKVSERGKEGHDVESNPYRLAEPITRWEAKFTKALPQWLRDWQEQAVRQGSPVAFREDRGEFWVMLPLAWLQPMLAIPETELAELIQLTAEEVAEVREAANNLLRKLR